MSALLDSKILEEFKNILVSEDNYDNECISIYNVVSLLINKRKEYNCLNTKLKHHLDYRTVNYHARHFKHYTVEDFNYEKMELPITYWDGFSECVNFVKKDGILYFTKENYMGKHILGICGNEISVYYDECLKFKDFFEQCSYGIKSTNSNFKINIDKNEVSVVLDAFDNDFKLSLQINKDEYDSPSNNLINMFRNREDEIFKKIFVKISDCPEWMHSELCKIREKQLKKGKVLELKRKLFPFLKK